jgi:hypothetical protein
LLLAQILKGKGQPVAHLVVDRVGDEHPAGIGQGFDPRGDVDAVAIEVVALDDHVAEVDADAQFDVVIRANARVSLGHRLLHRDRAAHRIDDTGELDQHAVAGGLDDAAMVLGDFRIDQLPPQRLEAFERAFLIHPHQPRIPRHIGGKDRGEATFDAIRHCGTSPPGQFGFGSCSRSYQIILQNRREMVERPKAGGRDVPFSRRRRGDVKSPAPGW